MRTIVPVALGARSYDIHIGPDLLAEAGALLAPLVTGPRVPVVTDETVAKLHLPVLAASLAKAGLSASPIVLPPGEPTKSFAGLERLIDALLAQNVERGGVIVALGGGVIGDLAGFAAGILKRGVDYVQVPTTLLAQVDSSVGGKTAIDTPRGKNLVGLFHQPRLVIADTRALATLPRRELLGGYAEIVKYGLLGDAGFFAWLETNGTAALGGDEAALVHAVRYSCEMKAAIVARDEREGGERALLNLGHTFGHALEAATGFGDRLSHGESVAIGCVLAFRLSARIGPCGKDDADRAERHLKAAGLPTRIGDIPGARPTPAALLDAMRHDKKARGGRLTFVLMRSIGQAYVENDVSEEVLLEILGRD